MIQLYNGLLLYGMVVMVGKLSVASLSIQPLARSKSSSTLLFITHQQQHDPSYPNDLSRRCVLQKILTSSAISFILPVADAEGAEELEEGFPLNKLPSGLKYLELKEGNGPTPRYGQLCSIQFTGYIKLPNSPQKEKYDSNVFLLKHGNGRVIAGLDEGLHSMKVGGTRRLIIPPKLGYVESGLGPLPEYPWDRWKLSNLLDDMVAQRGGNVVIDVTLRSAIDDEADQGYYQDESLSPEQLEALQNRLQQPRQATVITSATEMTI
jgi:hypothetical protein